MRSIQIGKRSFVAPVFVPSVSSFETQLSPAGALKLQFALQEPISLVSAFDVARDPELVPLCENFRKNGTLLIDSGGYETARIKKYAGGDGLPWLFEDYAAICGLDLHDLIFSFDYFIEASEDLSAFEDRFLSVLGKHFEYVDPQSLVPVIHLQSQDGKRRLREDEALHVVRKVTSLMNFRFIAIPERELGAGLRERARSCRVLANHLKETSPQTFLHILGCGNLLSFSYFSVAGAMMCDGLEWCRTCAASNFHLHHFQQGDLFDYAVGTSPNPALDILLGQGIPYEFQVAAKNLVSFQSFSEVLHKSLDEGTIQQAISSLFGNAAAVDVRGYEI